MSKGYNERPTKFNNKQQFRVNCNVCNRDKGWSINNSTIRTCLKCKEKPCVNIKIKIK
jgi:hypothetical protein